MTSPDPAIEHYGIEVNRANDAVSASMTVSEAMLNGHGTCHGGVLFLLADAAFDYTANGPMPDDQVAFAAHAEIDFTQAAVVGDRLTAVGTAVDEWGRTKLTDVKITNQRDETVAYFRGRTRTVNKR